MVDPISTIKYQTILAAGGNPTGIVRFSDSSRRAEYAGIANYFMSQNPQLEQFGFLEGTDSFYMSGGEFSGNGARAAAWLIYKLTGNKFGIFTNSGLTKPVNYSILSNGDVQCDFYGLQLQSKEITFKDGLGGKLVDLGGIIHFVFDPKIEFINEPGYYKATHSRIIKELDLEHRPAVGVIWQETDGKQIRINPIVWVRDINSFFYETACGSGTLAVLEASGLNNLSVIQPSGKEIQAFKNNGIYSLVSEVTEVQR